uniref:Uncharacterized protein n=1 Tax=mine drainage metagenome TaxID=410659 RepID=E6QLF6_9ZZZZ
MRGPAHGTPAQAHWMRKHFMRDAQI